MIIIKTPAQIDGIRRSSQLAAQTLQYTAKFIRPGITTETLNQIAHKYILDHHAVPAPLNYSGFPKSICTSRNDIVCHGIPDPKEILKDGDIINLDITTILDGYYGDVSASYFVGNVKLEVRNFVNHVKKSLDLAISAVKPGKKLNQCVGTIIENYLSPLGFSPVHDLGGHGVGLEFHEDPFVYHYQTDRDDVLLKPGMTFTVEPMVNMSPDWRVRLDKKDGWTVRTRDGSLSAQFEHTLLVTKTGAEVLTKI